MYTILYNKSRLRILVCTRLVSVVCVTPMTANAGFVIPTFKLEKSRYSFHRNDRCSSTHQLTAWQSSVSSSISCASLTTFYLLIFIFLFAFICTRSFPLSSQHQLQFDLVFVRILFFCCCSICFICNSTVVCCCSWFVLLSSESMTDCVGNGIITPH